MDDENLTLPVNVADFPVTSLQPGNSPGDIIQWNGTAWTITQNNVSIPLVIENYTGVTPDIPVSLSQGYIYKKPLDDNLYWVTNGGGELALLTSAPGGSVTGPATSTNNALVLWNGATGTSIKDSTVTLTAGIFSNLASSTAVSYDTTLNQNNQPILAQQTDNLLVGLLALDNLTIGTGNVAIGPSALNLCASAAQNTAVGYQTLSQLTTQSRNTAVGYSAAQNTVATDNTAVGNEALTANTLGTYNTALGSNALLSSTTTNNNTAIGYDALRNAVAANNTAVGYQAGSGITVGSYNAVLGCSSITASLSSAHNTVLGCNSLNTAVGDGNVAIGSTVAAAASSTNNVLVGYQASAGAGIANNRVVLGYGAIGLADNSLTLANSITAIYAAGLTSAATTQVLYYDTVTGAISRSSLSASVITGGPLQLSDGTNLLPTYSFTNDPDTGMYGSTGLNTIYFATNGLERLSISNTALTTTLPIYTAAGSVSLPSYTFVSDTNTGMYSSATDTIDFTTNAVNRLSISTTSITSTLPITATSFSGSGASLTSIPQSAVTSLVTDLANKQPLDADLTAIAALSTTGLATRTASNTWTTRTITGTAGTITVTNGDGVSGNPTLTIASSYVGQATITTLGTITTGTWSATTIATTRGGTGLTGYTTGNMLYASGSNTLTTLAIGSSGQVLMSNGTLPAWTTYTGSTSVTTLGTITTGTWNGTWLSPSYGGTGINIYAIGDMLYADSTTTLTKLTVGTSGQVLTSTGSAPSWTSTLALPAGSVAAPAYSFSGDSNTGMYASAADEISFATNGFRRLYMNSNATNSLIPFRGGYGYNGEPTFSFTDNPDTGFYGSDTAIFVSVNGISKYSFTDTQFYTIMPITTISNVYVGNGSASTPSYNFTDKLNLGMYYAGVDALGFSTAGVNRLTINTATITSTLSIVAPNGTTGSPSIRFIGDLASGIYSNVPGSIDITSNGTTRLTVNTSAVTSTLPIYNQKGTVSAPVYTFTADPDTGIYSSGTDILDFATGGVNRLSLNTSALTTTLPIIAPNGTNSAPAFKFVADSNTGIYSAAAASIDFTVNGTLQLTIDSTPAIKTTVDIYPTVDNTNKVGTSTNKFSEVNAGTVTATTVAATTVNVGTGPAPFTALYTAPLYGARCWASFDGDGTVTIYHSSNVDSIVRSSTGLFTVVITVNAPSNNYCIVGSCREPSGTPTASSNLTFTPYSVGTSTFGIATSDASGNDFFNPAYCSFVCYW